MRRHVPLFCDEWNASPGHLVHMVKMEIERRSFYATLTAIGISFAVLCAGFWSSAGSCGCNIMSAGIADSAGTRPRSQVVAGGGGLKPAPIRIAGETGVKPATAIAGETGARPLPPA